MATKKVSAIERRLKQWEQLERELRRLRREHKAALKLVDTLDPLDPAYADAEQQLSTISVSLMHHGRALRDVLAGLPPTSEEE